MKKLLATVLGWLKGDYWNGCVYTIEPEGCSPETGHVSCAAIDDLQSIIDSPHKELNTLAWTPDADAWAFGAWVDGDLAAVCWVQARETYRKRGGLFDLSENEAELAQISTAQAFRGKGVATALIRFVAVEMKARNFCRLYAKIWRGNDASIRAFERAGWRFKMRFFSLRLAGMKKPLIWHMPS